MSHGHLKRHAVPRFLLTVSVHRICLRRRNGELDGNRHAAAVVTLAALVNATATPQFADRETPEGSHALAPLSGGTWERKASFGGATDLTQHLGWRPLA